MSFCLDVVKFWCSSNVYPNPDIILTNAAGRTGGIVVDSGDDVAQIRILKDEPFYIILIIIYNLYQYFILLMFLNIKLLI